MADNGRPNEAEMFLRKMQLVGFVPDVDIFTALVSSYERSGQPGRALQLMESMDRDGYNTAGEDSSFDILALKRRVGRRKPGNRVGGQ